MHATPTSALRAWLACPECRSRDVSVTDFSADGIALACNDCGHRSRFVELPDE